MSANLSTTTKTHPSAPKDEMYNPEKQTPIFEVMAQKSILIVGAGAIGSFICEMCVRNGAGYVAVVDKDHYEIGNIPKSSFAIKYPEDIGKSKAVTIANNLSARCKRGTHIKGFSLDVKKLGPMALNKFDYVILALDNLAMKIFAQKLIKLCPEQPILFSCGTNQEFSEALIFAPDGACLRCTIPNEWLLSENPETVHSCAAPVNYLLPQRALPIVSTSGIASMKSAIDIDEMLTSHATGKNTLEKTQRYIQVPYPNKSGHSTFVAPLSDCPVCSMTPPSDVTALSGSTLNLTLRELLSQISAHYHSPFRLKVHVLEIPGVPEQVYDQFVIKEKCRSCKEEFQLAKHSGELRQAQILCERCSASNNASIQYFDNPDVVATRYFSLEDTPESILDMRLFDLGYPVGCYYQAEKISENKIESETALSELYDNIFGDEDGNKFFYLDEDCDFLMKK